MSEAQVILAEISRRGIAVRVDGQNLRLRPREALDDDLLARIREHKPEIIQEVITQGYPVIRCETDKNAHSPQSIKSAQKVERRQAPKAIPEGWVVLAPRLSGGSKPQSAIPNCSCCHKPWKVNRPRKWEGKTYAWLEPACRCLDAPKMRCCGRCLGHCECRWAQ